ncbi:transporter [Roseateles aquatilis]|uniref:Transporter n=1 Tax=Roseateles aquatilis TaxID=431061 RepID=A0A246JH64_9BURK|nr:TolC family protein [Roseateles aquatilis]OWQ91892.1 transporter [Roseateles aquatilis]
MSTLVLRAAAIAAALLPAIAPASPLSFDQALRLAAQRSEAARAALAAAASAHESARAAGQLPDPTLRAGVDNLPATGPDRFATTRDSMTMKRIGFSQEWLSAEKRAARAHAALAVADRDSLQAASAMAEARLQAALAYVDAWHAGRVLALATQAEHHLREEQDIATARLATAGASGAPAGAEALALASARGQAEDDSAQARQDQAAALLTLRRWVGVPPDTLLDAPAFPAPAASEYLARHPMLALLRREVDIARRGVTVATSERTSNWTWEVSYGQRTGYADMVSVGVSIPLQIAPGRRQDREVAAKAALVDKSEAELAEATRTAMADFDTLASDADLLRQRIDRYAASVVQPARQRTGVALAAYRANQAALSGVFEARHAELEAERKLIALHRALDRVSAQLAFKPLAQGDAP